VGVGKYGDAPKATQPRELHRLKPGIELGVPVPPKMGSWQVEIPRRAKRHLRSPPDHAEDKEEGRGCKDREQLPYYRNRASAVGMPSHDLGQLIKAQFPTLALAKPIPEEGEKGDSGGGGGETGCRTSNSTESSQEGWVVLGFTLVEKGPWPPRRSSQNGLILVKNEPR